MTNNHNMNTPPVLLGWLHCHPDFSIHVTPTSASWLNQIERFISKIATPRIWLSDYHSVSAVEAGDP
jgi:hypothetical protein